MVSPQITFVGESVIGWVTFKEQLSKGVTVNEFQRMVRRSLRRSKIRKLILPFDNRFHLTCQGSHFWNRTLFDWWWGHHKKGHMKKTFYGDQCKVHLCRNIGIWRRNLKRVEAPAVEKVKEIYNPRLERSNHFHVSYHMNCHISDLVLLRRRSDGKKLSEKL